MYFDTSPYAIVAFFGVTFVALGLVFLLDRYSTQGVHRGPHSDWRWGIVIVAMLVAGRWGAMMLRQTLNPDESILVAGAITLRHDPIFWRSVFGLTTGPLDFYALLPVGTLFGDTFPSARITAALLLSGALLFAHQTLALRFDRTLARVATFPAICFEALTSSFDFLHHSTELLPILLLSAAFYFSFQLVTDHTHRTGWKFFTAGMLLGATPYAKLQAAPIALVGGAALFGYLWFSRLRHATLGERFILIAGAITPTLSLAVLLGMTPDKDGAVMSFLTANIAYAQRGFGGVLEIAGKMGSQAMRSGSLLVPWLAANVAIVLFTAPVWGRRKIRSNEPLVLIAGLFMIASLACIVAPRRPFLHYLQLLVIPLTITTGALLGMTCERLRENKGRSRKWMLSAAAVVPAIIIFGNVGVIRSRASSVPPLHRGTITDVSKVVLNYLSAGEALAVWGLSAHYYVETASRQATRHAITEIEIFNNRFAREFQSRYLTDFLASMPPVFLDASYIPAVYPIREIAHDIWFPELGELVRTNYTLVNTVDEVRIFVRNDRLAQRPLPVTGPNQKG